MIKNIIAPVQVWLLAQKRCVGCGTSLTGGNKIVKKGLQQIVCKCKRVYIYDKLSMSYRRALIKEV